LGDIASTAFNLLLAGFGIVFAIGARMFIRERLRRLRGML